MSATQTRFSRPSMLKLIAAIGVVVSAQAAGFAAGWSDNFNDGNMLDGNPVTWLNDLGGSGLFPGDYNPSSGDLVMTPAVDGSDASIMISLVPTVTFTDVYMRTQGVVLPDPANPTVNKGGNLVLLGRINPAELTGYLVYFDVSGNLNMQILIGGGAAFDIGTTFDAPFNAGTEVNVEMSIVGNQLSAYAWPVGDPRPSEPQVTATDDTFAAGLSGVAFAEDDDLTSGVFRYVSAQDTPFVDGVPGDYNNDGKVDAADYVLWRNGGPLANEVDTPGTVNAADYDAWRTRFGNTAGSGSSASLAAGAVPEPVTSTLALVGVFSSLLIGNRRRSRAITA